MVGYAYRRVPFYRRALDERALRPSDFQSAADLARLPLIDSVQVRTNLGDFTPTDLDRLPHQTYSTSGTLANAVKFIHWDHAALLNYLAHHERDRVVLNALAGAGDLQRQAFILTPGSPSERLREFWVRHTLLPRNAGDRHLISMFAPFEEVRERLNRIRPQVVFSFGSFTDRFFRYLADRSLELASPRVWVYGGDGLSATGAELMRRFGCIPYSTYQATETGRIGFQCERLGGFHLNLDLVALRLVDPRGDSVCRGESGEVVVSSLTNRATLLLNYRLNDRATLATAACPCGRGLPLLERLEGRSTDVVQLPDGREMSVPALEVFLIKQVDATIQTQLVIQATDQLIWRVVPARGVNCEVLRLEFQQRCRAVLGDRVAVGVEFLDSIPPTPAGKVPKVVSTLDPTVAGVVR